MHFPPAGPEREPNLPVMRTELPLAFPFSAWETLGMAHGGRRRCIQLLAQGVGDPAKLMLELKVGPARLRAILKSPSVRQWRARVELVKEELQRVPDALTEAGRRQAPEYVLVCLAAIIQGVCEGSYRDEEVVGMLHWLVRALDARRACRGLNQGEREEVAKTDEDVRLVLAFVPGLLAEPLPLA